MRRLIKSTGVALAALASLACDDPTSPAEEVPEPDVAAQVADATRGHLAFIAECASCHASRDGFDLAFFSFPDSAIVRRALGHVDTTTAFDIVAYIETLSVDAVGRFERSFQPGGVILSSDLDFATGLFGTDAWPSDLSSAQLAAIDPTQVPIALSFPRWSFEETNVDWMPDAPFPRELLQHSDDRAGSALRNYQIRGTETDLYNAALALRIAERDPGSTAAPCQLEEPARFDAVACFEARRWTASLVGQHMLREGIDTPMHFSLHDAWWDVGNVARKSLVHGTPIDNAEENWAVWMYLGWAFAPERHASTYLASGLTRLGLPRHATFHTLRAQVARPEGGSDAYKDLHTAIRMAPSHWLSDVAAFSYQNLIERLESGDVPDATSFRDIEEGMAESRLEEAWVSLQQARLQLWRRLPQDQVEALAVYHDQIIELLPPV